MKLLKKQLLCLLLLVFLLTQSVPVFATVTKDHLDAVIVDTAEYLQKTVSQPQVGSIGGEWAILGLARSGYKLPEAYYRNYYSAVESYVQDCDGVLDERKYSEYSRVILGLAAIGKDARNVAGYDLTIALGDYDKTVWQGINGPIWALLALDSRDYPFPQNPLAATQASRQMYVDYILAAQLPDGGWSLKGNAAAASDPDITGMALQALAKYQQQPAVERTIDLALDCLLSMQQDDGGFASGSTANLESCVQVIVALCELGIYPNDSRFVKDGNGLLDALLAYYLPGQGFRHMLSASQSNPMATEQAMYALSAVQRIYNGQNSLYRMNDAISIIMNETPMGSGLPGKHPHVQATVISNPGLSFNDISGHEDQTAMEALVVRGIIEGLGDGTFAPDRTMNRAQYAAIVVRALGLTPKVSDTFTDVPANKWYAPYAGTASQYGIITGVAPGYFNPDGTISRQEAAVMVARAAALCGLNTEMDSAAVRDVLAQFSDYITVPVWAQSGLAFCYSRGILDDSVLEIDPQEPVLRSEIARMLYRLLMMAELL